MLPNLLKIYKKVYLHKWLSSLRPFFPDISVVFEKCVGKQQCLLAMLE